MTAAPQEPLDDPYAGLPDTPEQAQQLAWDKRQAGAGLPTALVAYGLYRVLRAYRKEVRRGLRQLRKQRSDYTATEMQQGLAKISGMLLPGALGKLGPVVFLGLRNGAQQSGFRVTDKELDRVAMAYAESLMTELNHASMNAAMSGFHAMVNRKVPMAEVVRNVVDAWGITNKSVNTLVVMVTGKEDARLSDLPLVNRKRAKIETFIESSIEDRLHLISEQEGWNLTEQGKQLGWIAGLRSGAIPKEAEKVWVTAEDERVCAICGPMDRKQVSVTKTFELPNGLKLWTPTAHVNCRCRCFLVMPKQRRLTISRLREIRRKPKPKNLRTKLEERLAERRKEKKFAKADEDIWKADWTERKHPRDAEGQFKAKPKKQVQYAEAPTMDLQELLQDAQLAEALRDVPSVPTRAPVRTETETKEEAKTETPVRTVTPTRTVTGPKLATRSVTGPKLATRSVAKPKLARPKLNEQRTVAPGKQKIARPHRKVERPKRTLQEVNVALDQATRKLEGQIPRNLQDIPGEVGDSDPVEVGTNRNRRQWNNQRASMYAIVGREMNVHHTNERFRLDGAEVNEDRSVLKRQIGDWVRHRDARKAISIVNDEDNYFTYNGEVYSIDLPAVAEALTYARAVRDGYNPSSDLESSFAHVLRDRAVWTETGEEVSERELNEMSGDEYEMAMEDGVIVYELGDEPEPVPLTEIIDQYALMPYVNKNSPTLIEVNEVPGDDVDVDVNGAYYALVMDADYDLDSVHYTSVEGRKYLTFRAVPRWND